MDWELSQIVRNAAAQFVAEPSLKLLRSSYDFASFGDSLADYSANGLRVRVSRDRGELTIEGAVDRNPIRWRELESAVDLFGEVLPQTADEPARISRVLNQWFAKEPRVRQWLDDQDAR